MAQFESVITYEGVTLVDFYLSWCNPCRDIKRLIVELEDEYKKEGKKFHSIMLEVDTIPSLSRRMKVNEAPVLFFFVNGKESGKRITGYKEKFVLKARIDSELKKLAQA